MQAFRRSVIGALLLAFTTPLHAAECVSSSRATVAAEYRQILEREPDAGGPGWIAQLDVAHQTVEFLTRSFVKEHEYRLRFLWYFVVRDAYQQVLERNADQSGLDTWGNGLDSGTTVQNTVRALAQSTEYRTRFIDGRAPSDAVTLLFRHLLARDPSAAEVQSFVQQAQANGWPFVINALIDSAEYVQKFGPRLVPGRGRHAYEQAVTALYQHVLARQPESPSVIATWVNNILTMPWSTVADSIVSSGEYQQRFGPNAVPGNPSPAHYGNQRFQDCLNLGGTLELPAGVYNITKQLILTKTITITTTGLSTRSGNCFDYVNDCAAITADAAFYASGGMLAIDAPGVRMDHILFDGNRAKRINTPAFTDCKNQKGRMGYNASGHCESCSLTHSASINALCGSGFEWRGANAVIEDNAFVNNGDHTIDYLWADGLTLLSGNVAHVQRNFFRDNTDLDFICGGAKDAIVKANIVRHQSRASFGAMMLDNFKGTQSGDFSGLIMSENDIDCGAKLCDFGINVGPHPWSSTVAVIKNGEVSRNVVHNSKQGINVDGATNVLISGNIVDAISGSAQFRPCTHVVSSLNVNTADSSTFMGSTAPSTTLVWHDCQ